MIYVRRRPRKLLPNSGNSPRTTLTILSGVSLLLLLCLTDLWLRSYTCGEIWLRVGDGHASEFAVYRNQIHLSHGAYVPSAPRNETGRAWRHDAFYADGPGPWPPPSNFVERAGFAYQTSHPWFSRFLHISLPLWPLWLLCTVLPIRWLLVKRRLQRRHIRRLRGQCQSCGYDLTDNTSGTCPECGIAVARDEAVAVAPLSPG